MHLVMHANDTRNIIEGGWGERHPLCHNAKKWWMKWHHAHNDSPCLPGSLVLIYASLTPEHKEVVMTCVKAAAAAAYCAGIKMDSSDSGYGSGFSNGSGSSASLEAATLWASAPAPAMLLNSN